MQAPESRLEKIRQMLEQHAGDCFLWHALGLEYLKAGEPRQALQSFEEVLRLDAAYVGTYYHLAKTQALLGLRDEALHTCEQGIIQAGQARDQHARNELQQLEEDIQDQ